MNLAYFSHANTQPPRSPLKANQRVHFGAHGGGSDVAFKEASDIYQASALLEDLTQAPVDEFLGFYQTDFVQTTLTPAAKQKMARTRLRHVMFIPQTNYFAAREDATVSINAIMEGCVDLMLPVYQRALKQKSPIHLAFIEKLLYMATNQSPLPTCLRAQNLEKTMDEFLSLSQNGHQPFADRLALTILEEPELEKAVALLETDWALRPRAQKQLLTPAYLLQFATNPRMRDYFPQGMDALVSEHVAELMGTADAGLIQPWANLYKAYLKTGNEPTVRMLERVIHSGRQDTPNAKTMAQKTLWAFLDGQAQANPSTTKQLNATQDKINNSCGAEAVMVAFEQLKQLLTNLAPDAPVLTVNADLPGEVAQIPPPPVTMAHRLKSALKRFLTQWLTKGQYYVGQL